MQTELDAEIGRRSLHEFIRMAWEHVETVDYVDNWHIAELCKALEKVSEGVIKRLAINIPPGCQKSLTVCVFWQAWQWIQEPSHQFICASFDPSLTNRDAARLLKLVQSKWFQKRWPQVVPANEALRPVENPPVSKYRTTAGGLRFSTSVKGKGTGFHAHTQVIDDPSKPRDANDRAALSDKSALQEVINWWKTTMSSRAVNLAELRKVIIMQRLHENDLVGYVLENEEGWIHIYFPMRFDPEDKCRIVLDDGTIIEDQRTKEDELLFSKRFPEQAVRDLETTMGTRIAAAQLGQKPSASEGNIFKRTWFKHYDYIPQYFHYLIQSWDMTFKDTDGSDFVVGDLWGVIGADAYLLPGWVQKRMGLQETIKSLIAFSNKDELHRKAYLKLVEDKANGPAVVDSLKRKIPGLVLVNPDGGKVARANAITPFYESGNVWHPSPRLDPRISKREDTLAVFPNAKYDDIVDTTSQALLRLLVRSTNLIQAMNNVG